VQSIDAKLNQQSVEIAEMKLALRRLDQPQRNPPPQPTLTEEPVAPPQVEPPTVLASPLLEQDSDRGELCLLCFKFGAHNNNYPTCRYLKLIEVNIVAEKRGLQ